MQSLLIIPFLACLIQIFLLFNNYSLPSLIPTSISYLNTIKLLHLSTELSPTNLPKTEQQSNHGIKHNLQAIHSKTKLVDTHFKSTFRSTRKQGLCTHLLELPNSFSFAPSSAP